MPSPITYQLRWAAQLQAIRSIAHHCEPRVEFYARNRVDVIDGRATFVDAHCVEVAVSNGARHRCRADKVIVATGLRPYRPPDADFSHPRIVDSDTVLRGKQTPRSITIYGAGVIGCEYASIFRGLRIKINLINAAFHYPTMAEAYRAAALNGLNRVR